ncbi:hypothetical protein FF38_00127 [Lucilia cuprina]|uniref:Uncharacterized protein n=1 Tax=Lucilia cuprina TaxID=7375 RepID=A0A0L0CL37_LUCCU|nr:hypothetical protein FF38_00127 [Lucilia cuprina]
MVFIIMTNDQLIPKQGGRQPEPLFVNSQPQQYFKGKRAFKEIYYFNVDDVHDETKPKNNIQVHTVSMEFFKCLKSTATMNAITNSNNNNNSSIFLNIYPVKTTKHLILIPAEEISLRPRACIWLPKVTSDTHKMLEYLKRQNPNINQGKCQLCLILVIIELGYVYLEKGSTSRSGMKIGLRTEYTNWRNGYRNYEQEAQVHIELRFDCGKDVTIDGVVKFFICIQPYYPSQIANELFSQHKPLASDVPSNFKITSRQESF